MLIQDLLPTPIGMSLTLSRKLLQHEDSKQLLKQAQENGQRTLVLVHHDVEKIDHVLEPVKKDAEQWWWNTLFR